MDNNDNPRRELSVMVRSLKTQIELDMDLGRSLSYLSFQGEGPSKGKSSLDTVKRSADDFFNIIETTERSDGPAQPKACLTLEMVREELGDCRRCSLYKTRTNLVFGEGNPYAKLVFVGEAPGADEDAQGRPFVGRAGQLLTKIIAAMGLTRNDVYICNILKCRPPGNKDPVPEEIQACEPFLIKQIESIRPEVICALGTFSAQTLLKKNVPISTIRGRFHTYQGIKLMPTYHPAYCLRNPSAKKPVWDDIQMIMKLLGKEEKAT